MRQELSSGRLPSAYWSEIASASHACQQKGRDAFDRVFTRYQLAVGPGSVSVPRDDPPHAGQADAGPFKLLRSMQALKHAKQLVDVAHIESGSIVANVEFKLLIRPAAPDLDGDGVPRACV